MKRVLPLKVTLLLVIGCGVIVGGETVSSPTLAVCVAADASPAVRHAAEAVLAAIASQPLLKLMAGKTPPLALVDSAALLHARIEERAYRHLVLVGLPTDPLIAAAWQHEAQPETGGLYVFAFGHLRGDVGYLESDRNPFLHSDAIATAPFETEVVTLTGATPAAVGVAVDAFLARGLVNGVVAKSGWTRAQATLLDRDPLAPDVALPEWIPESAGKAQRIALTQAGADEYRGVLADCAVEPRQIWRVKYHRAESWSAAGAHHAIQEYIDGLHRRAYGSSVWLAEFASAAEAGAAAPAIAKAARLVQHGDGWSGAQPPYSAEKESPGALTLWRRDQWVVMSTLSADDTAALRAAMR